MVTAQAASDTGAGEMRSNPADLSICRLSSTWGEGDPAPIETSNEQ